MELRIPILAVIDARKSIPPMLNPVISPQESHRDAFHFRTVTAPYEQMPNREFTHRFFEDVVEVRARSHSGKICRVPLLRGCQIQAVESRVVEEIALEPEGLAIHLFPFNRRLDAHLHRSEVQSFRARWCTCVPGRSTWARAARSRRRRERRNDPRLRRGSRAAGLRRSG